MPEVQVDQLDGDDPLSSSSSPKRARKVEPQPSGVGDAVGEVDVRVSSGGHRTAVGAIQIRPSLNKVIADLFFNRRLKHLLSIQFER
jgi:hypothetical protein